MVAKHPTTKDPLDQHFAVIDSKDKKPAIRNALQALHLDVKDFAASSITMLARFIFEQKEAFALGRNPFEDQDSVISSSNLQNRERLYNKYCEDLISSNHIDLSDMAVLLGRELFIKNDKLPDIFRSRWTHMLVEEFQDTSTTQGQLNDKSSS